MNPFMTKIILFSLIFIFLFCLFWWIYSKSLLKKIYVSAKSNLEQKREQVHQNQRRNIILQQERSGFVYGLEKRLLYTRISVIFPLITPPVYLALRLVFGASVYFFCNFFGAPFLKALLITVISEFVLYLLENLIMQRNYNRTEESLIKLLDFLGNYSVTTSEITWILSQICDYMEEPVKGVLEECCVEAQTTGDSSVALLYMAEKLEHPKFQEMIRNLEISIRYAADLTILVMQSKKTIGEYMRLRQERKALTREAWVNILILGSMSLVILKAVGALLEIPINELLFQTIPGILCVSCIVIILFLFYFKIRKLDI